MYVIRLKNFVISCENNCLPERPESSGEGFITQKGFDSAQPDKSYILDFDLFQKVRSIGFAQN